jgi:hypothetical protein
MKTTTPAARWALAGLAALILPLAVPALVNAQDTDGFDGYVQGGTCVAPRDDLRVELAGGEGHDIQPYRAESSGQDVVLGYYGSPQVPGFGLGLIYTDQRFSLVINDAGGAAAACGDILRPVADEFGEAGIAPVQLLPVGDSGVQGVAVLQRTRLQRELDVIPTRVRVLLATQGTAVAPAPPAAGYHGHVQGGTCQAPTGAVRSELVRQSEFDVGPYLAEGPSGATVTPAYYGSAAAPGLGLASAYTGKAFSLVLTDPAGGETACGDILKPSSDTFVEAGMALVRLQAPGGTTVPGYAVIQRVGLQRELDVTPTRVLIVLFAAPVTRG